MGIALIRGGRVAWMVGWGACPLLVFGPACLLTAGGSTLSLNPERAGLTLVSSVWLQVVGAGGPIHCAEGVGEQGLGCQAGV